MVVTRSEIEILPNDNSPRMVYPYEMISVQAELHDDILILSGFGLKTQTLGSQNSSRFVVLW